MITINNPSDIKEVSQADKECFWINQIKHLYPDLRQKSKSPTFALQYGGTNHTLVINCGLDKETALQIEDNYNKMYKVSNEWVKEKIKTAETTGYVELAFGLKLRTPKIHKSIYAVPSTPYEVSKEARTAGNALSGQSYGLLNTRAAIEFMERVYASEFRYDIRPVALIHDAIYLVIKDNLEVIHWVNENLIKCMQYQDLPEIQHDIIKIGAELDLYRDWSNPVTLDNGMTLEEVQAKWY